MKKLGALALLLAILAGVLYFSNRVEAQVGCYSAVCASYCQGYYYPGACGLDGKCCVDCALSGDSCKDSSASAIEGCPQT